MIRPEEVGILKKSWEHHGKDVPGYERSVIQKALIRSSRLAGSRQVQVVCFDDSGNVISE